jgi:hypothetical protein
MMSPFLLVDEIIAAQTPKLEAPFIEILRGVQQIIEIGFHRGGFSLWLHQHKRSDCMLVCYDITNEYLLVPPKHNIDFRIGDCFSFDTANEIIGLIRRPQKTLLLCEGGNKEKEFNFYCEFMKPGDIIMLHDYADNNENYQRIKARLNWPSPAESFYNNIRQRAEACGLKKYNYDEMKEVLWGAFVAVEAQKVA